MQIIINAPEGTSTAYAVEGTTTVTDLKSMIENREFIPGHLIKLVSGDAELLEGGGKRKVETIIVPFVTVA